MIEPSDDRKDTSPLIAEIAEFIRHHATGSILRVGIDGVDGVGKTVFADTLARVIGTLGRPVIRASVDSFHNTREIRYRQGKTSPHGFYADSYNYVELRKVLLDPLGPGGSRVYCPAIFDHTVNAPVAACWSIADPDAVLVFDGIFLHRPELRDVWNLSIFLDAPFATIPRGAGRGPGYGSADVDAASNRRYIEGQRLYPRKTARISSSTIPISRTLQSQPAAGRPEWGQIFTIH
ncbi:uridine kinase [Tardiphaga robiniae]|uniref:uridine kinase n=1 Tax=Tardiphaga robiniae TaxID=943830 RepID=UPI001AEE691A|nr:uridine kinase [Tardiphaga robiniae]